MKVELDDAFEELMRRAWPKVSQSSTQFHESRRVWFAAVHWTLCIISRLADQDEETTNSVLEQLDKQIDEFVKNLKTEDLFDETEMGKGQVG
jgi:hypothetical protein